MILIVIIIVPVIMIMYYTVLHSAAQLRLHSMTVRHHSTLTYFHHYHHHPLDWIATTRVSNKKWSSVWSACVSAIKKISAVTSLGKRSATCSLTRSHPRPSCAQLSLRLRYLHSARTVWHHLSVPSCVLDLSSMHATCATVHKPLFSTHDTKK